MVSGNPYDSPKQPAETGTASGPGLGVLVGSAAFVFGVALVGGVVGMGIGAALGTFVPGYYRSVFVGGYDPHFDPVAVGIGQGLTQGVMFGGLVGLALVALFYWHRSRRRSSCA